MTPSKKQLVEFLDLGMDTLLLQKFRLLAIITRDPNSHWWYPVPCYETATVFWPAIPKVKCDKEEPLRIH